MRTNDGSEPRQSPLRRALGGIFVLLVLTVVAGSIASLGLAWVRPGITKFDVVPREKYRRTPGPVYILLNGQLPSVRQDQTAAPTSDVRAIHLLAKRVDLRVGGRVERTIPLKSPVLTLAGLVSLVNDPSWLRKPAPDRIDVLAGIVVDQGAQLLVTAPDAGRVVLNNLPDVILAAYRGGRLVFDGVSVESNVTVLSRTQESRPSIIATDNAVMDIKDSTFSNLGWDWSASYGVSWVADSKGSAIRSTFKRNFFGVYSSQSSDLRFVDCVFRDNDVYGLDPHTGSKNLYIENALAEGNKAHGIIFSEDVVGSVIRNSVSRDNGENGIMMDLRSTGNVIEGNLVEHNRGDGIVTANSPNTTIRNNVIRSNRIGLRIDPADAPTVTAIHNQISENSLSYQGLALHDSNRVWDNGGQWRMAVLGRIWLIVGWVFVGGAFLVLLGTGLLRRRVVVARSQLLESRWAAARESQVQRRRIHQRDGTGQEPTDGELAWRGGSSTRRADR